MSFSPAQAVANARGDVGFVEGPNNANPYSLWQYGDYHEPYCDSAVCKWSYDAGFRFDPWCSWGAKGDSNVGAHHAHAVRAGRWRSRSYRASPGDLVILSFGIPDQHIEQVLSDAGGDRIATIGGNTSDRVAFRTRWRSQIVGFDALTLSPQAAGHPAPHPQEVKTMGMIGGVPVPGAHPQTKAPWKGREPMVVAINHADGRGDLVGLHGAELTGATAYLGMSILHLAGGVRLNKPMRSISLEQDKAGTWSGAVVALADDYGTFRAVVKAVHYL